MMEEAYKKALDLDRNDPLIDFRDRFVNDAHVIYLDGNSLGKLPKRTNELTSDIVSNQWGSRLIRSWNESWIELSAKTATKVARIVGADEDEIFVGDSTTVNLYKLAHAVLAAAPGKNKIISDELNFPADLYVMQGLIEQQFKDYSLELMMSSDGVVIEGSQLREHIDKQTALVTLSHVTYKSSFMYNMELVNSMAHKSNSLVIWDLSHAAGAVPVELNRSNADMAVGCTYKYLNGGPGAPAFLYVRRDLQEKLINPITSWFSHSQPFEFNLSYQSIPTIQKFATGTPNILSLAAIEPGLDITLDAGMDRIRKKSIRQSDFMIKMIEESLLPLGFTIASPHDEKIRGSHISIQHSEAYRINRSMIEPSDGSKVVIPDFRPPNNIRLGITPLYTSYMDIYYAINRIREIVNTNEFERFSKEKLKVT